MDSFFSVTLTTDVGHVQPNLPLRLEALAKEEVLVDLDAVGVEGYSPRAAQRATAAVELPPTWAISSRTSPSASKPSVRRRSWPTWSPSALRATPPGLRSLPPLQSSSPPI